LNVTEELRLSCDATEKTKQEIVNYIWEWLNGLWTPDGKTIPTSTSYLRFWDTERSQFVDLSLLIDTDENPDAPLLAISQGVIVKKDFAAGGFLSSNQGALALGSGLDDFDDVPKLWLIHSELPARHNIEERTDIPSTPVVGQAFVYTGQTQGNWVQNHLYRWTGILWSDLGHKTEWDWTFDTLHLTKFDGSTPAHMHLGKLTATGGAKLNAVAIGKDEYGDIPYEYESIQLNPSHNLRFCFGTNERMVLSNAGRLELSVQGSSGGLKIGDDVSLYKQSAAVLRIASNVIMDGPSFTIDHSVDNPTINLKKGGAERIMIGHDGSQTYFSARTGNLFINTVQGDIVLQPTGNNVLIGAAGVGRNLLPWTVNYGNIGSNTQYWGSGWFNYLRYKNLSIFDALDDLALVKQYTTKSIVEDDVEREVVDLETLPIVKADGADFVDSGKLGGFLLGCVKKLVLRVEKLEAELKNLEN